VFPAGDFAAELNEILLPLAHLYNVHILIWGDRSLPSTGWTSCDKHQWPLPDFLVDYRFGRPIGEPECFSWLKRTCMVRNGADDKYVSIVRA
jgi:hypothetical protein